MIARAEPECPLPVNVFANDCPFCDIGAPVIPTSLTVTISNDECSCQEDVIAGTLGQVVESIVEIIQKGVAELEGRD